MHAARRTELFLNVLVVGNNAMALLLPTRIVCGHRIHAGMMLSSTPLNKIKI